jgi:serine/threonine-protein kinase HipA
VVDRFDRQMADDKRWIMRLPQEDLCQALGMPAGLKYESDGGPGILEIMTILRGSDDATADRSRFMKSVFLFWVLGAMDGHAKNFSIKIGPQGRYHLTPLYDVISAYPIIAKRQLQWQNLKMAMALKGKHKHYVWSTLQVRHWLAMAKLCQFPVADMQTIIEEVCDNMDKVIDRVSSQLPAQFPSQMSESLFVGMRQVKFGCVKAGVGI